MLPGVIYVYPQPPSLELNLLTAMRNDGLRNAPHAFCVATSFAQLSACGQAH